MHIFQELYLRVEAVQRLLVNAPHGARPSSDSPCLGAFPHGIPGCCGNWEKAAHGNLWCLLRPWTEDQLRHIAVDRQVLDSEWQVVGPLRSHEFYSNDIHQVAQFITRWVHTDGVGESPCCAIFSTWKVLIVHALAEAFWGPPYKYPDSPISNIYCTEFHHIPLSTPTQLHLSIFSTDVGLRILPVHSLESAISKHAGRVGPPNGKKLSCAEQGQELLVNIAVPPLPKLSLHKLPLCASVGTEEKIPLKNSFCGFFKILWWFVRIRLLVGWWTALRFS